MDENTLTPYYSDSYFRQTVNKWDDEAVKEMDMVDRLVYRSNLIGSDSYINNTGGGNTSSKIIDEDPITGADVEVLWVKGSGGDLRTAKRSNFASLYQKKLLELQEIYDNSPDKGPKTQAEDAMVGKYQHCTYNLNPRAPSIDTPLHSFLPFKFVDHTHPVPCIAIATAENGEELTKQIYGDDVEWVDWLRPGFELGLKLQETVKRHPKAKGIILGGHGLINWADDDKECYLTTLELINKAASFLGQYDKGEDTFGGPRYDDLSLDDRLIHLTHILPFIRGLVSIDNRLIGTVQYDEPTMQFINSKDAPRLAELGTSCPDHFLRTKIKPLFVDWDPPKDSDLILRTRLTEGLNQYRKDYESYYNKFKVAGSPPMRNASPSVILIPGLGMITWGKTKSESRVTAEFYNAAIGVMRGAESVSRYTALPKREAFDIEYWALEEAKLKRMPPEKELSRNIIAVIGAGSGIGKGLVGRLIDEGAVVAALDLNRESVKQTADEILDRHGMGIGVSGSGISEAGDIIGLEGDISNRTSIEKALNSIVLAYGGLDSIAITAGLYAVPDQNGKIDDDSWDKSFAVNVKGAYVVADSARQIWDDQHLSGNLVITTSANAIVPKTGSFAYDTTKAAANHLVRELAIELAPLVRVNGVAPATVVEGSSMFPRNRVIASLKKYSLKFNDDEDTETLKNRLAEFYAGRTLTKRPISLNQQAEAIFLLLSHRLENTTGHIIPVDGGLVEAFMR